MLSGEDGGRGYLGGGPGEFGLFGGQRMEDGRGGVVRNLGHLGEFEWNRILDLI